MNRSILRIDMILQGKELAPVKKGALIAESGRIYDTSPQHVLGDHSIGDARGLCSPGQTLMPGMIECRDHLCVDATLPDHLELLEQSSKCQFIILALRGLKEDLLSGVTTARCIDDEYCIDAAMKKMIRKRKIKGPRLLAAGIGMGGSHGVGYIGSLRCDADGIRDIYRKNMRKGVDLLRSPVTPGVPDPNPSFVPSSLSLEEAAMAVSEGARPGIPVAAHYIGGQDLKGCIEGGVQVIEHICMVTEQDAELLAASNCVVDLTSGIFLDPSREAFLPPSNARKVHLNRPHMRENVTRILKAGLPLVLDTDAYHGYLYCKVGHTVELGADTVTVLQGITSHMADIYGLGHKLGSLVPGLAADVVAIKGDPLEQVSCLSQVGFVMKDGTICKQ